MPKLPLTLTLVFALAACSKNDPPAPEAKTEATAASASLGATDAGIADASTDAAGIADASTDAARIVDASTDASDGGRAAVEASAPKPPTCGAEFLPDCPLQAWMKANNGAAMTAKDLAALQVSLEATAGLAPTTIGFPNWRSIAFDGAEAARVRDLGAVKAACRGCHDQYKSKYRAEIRERPIP